MGADGGSIAKRSEIISAIGSAPRQTKVEDIQSIQWTRCSLTGEELEDPVVSDWDGNIYNKAAVLQYLLGILPEKLRPKTNISQTRDIVELKREFRDNEWIDPVTRKVLRTEGQSESFAYLAECGHVSSANIISKASCCPVCERSFTMFVYLNPHSASAKESNRKRIEALEKEGLSNNLRPLKRKLLKRKRAGNDESHSKYGKSSDHTTRGDEESRNK